MDLDRKLADFEKALLRLKEAYQKTIENTDSYNYTFFRDSTIQRFEFTVEIMWKTVKSFLIKQEGIECRSPKSCIKDLFSAGYLDSEKTAILLEMIDDRNLTSHTYHEEVSEKIFGDLRSYIPVLEYIYKIIEENV
ncbi:MAG: nucleotidyltransferase substrate binding protein [Hydrogenothermaceae bacterium]|nr:nucleotidyltransferase substrate binding protein [Hydrogenothermaceae bacterium]